MCLDVLEHLQNDKAGARELTRVLRKGGRAVVTVPAYRFLWSVTDVLSHHFRRYSRSEITDALSDFEIERITYFNTFLFPPIAAMRFLNRFIKTHDNEDSLVSGGFINTVLYTIFHLESILLRYMNFPFGVSILVVARRPL
jgi:SAM-dependent methyltransferase